VRVFLVRHAEAAPGEPDELRPLTESGHAAARALGERLATARPDAVLCSPLLRARETADHIARAVGLAPTPDERLAPGADLDDVRAVVTGKGDTVVVVGHQPDCSQIVLTHTGSEIAFAPAAVAELELDL
jgi:phosphohistidine phosphatase SixA